MPILHHAKKKLRADLKKRMINKAVKTRAVGALDKARKEKTAENLKMAFSALDKAAKGGVFHKKKSDRLKSRLSKLFSSAK
jgi:small subunit ribosomal protein S20